MQPPSPIRAIAFVDGQNLFHSAKASFGHRYPNYNVRKLAKAVCEAQGWELEAVRFYTGVPDAKDNAFWNHFWVAKGAQMGREGVHVHTRALRYRTKTVRLPDGKKHSFVVGDEKGIDIRIALDVIRLAQDKAYDVALVFSQDQDLSEAAIELRRIASEQNRWIKIASAFPENPRHKTRGIEQTDWLPISREVYDACLDPRDYRPKT
ncbi:NYN domain-containing protein [Stappia sp. ES.058]|uniref:NYN domain-containing protein n=1 Tax=Stappia sp. ES.058 TaxID=1881061 RepID=UPI00087B451D|nr:NYN domain-containing protein [Stappia sp. ES.058]SDT93882.1 NYN domain-containing protein [Stappia sp. ES.058]